MNSAGVMPIIFSSSLMALPATLARFTDNGAVTSVANLFVQEVLIHTRECSLDLFLQLFLHVSARPKDVAEQLKKQGASIPRCSTSKNTREYITKVLERLSLLGSLFLGFLALTPVSREPLDCKSSEVSGDEFVDSCWCGHRLASESKSQNS